MINLIYAWLDKRCGDARRRLLLEKVDGYRTHAAEVQREFGELKRRAAAAEDTAKNWMHRYNQLHDRHLNDARRESLGLLKFIREKERDGTSNTNTIARS